MGDLLRLCDPPQPAYDPEVVCAVQVTDHDWEHIGVPPWVCLTLDRQLRCNPEFRVYLGDWIVWDEEADGRCRRLSDSEFNRLYKKAEETKEEGTK